MWWYWCLIYIKQKIVSLLITRLCNMRARERARIKSWIGVCVVYIHVYISLQGGSRAGSDQAVTGWAAGWAGSGAALLRDRSFQEGGGVCWAGPRTAQTHTGQCGRSVINLQLFTLFVTVSAFVLLSSFNTSVCLCTNWNPFSLIL